MYNRFIVERIQSLQEKHKVTYEQAFFVWWNVSEKLGTGTPNQRIFEEADIELKNKTTLSQEVNPEELKLGIEVEKEHTDDPDIAEKIARDHLAELPDYYTRLKAMEKGQDEDVAPIGSVATLGTEPRIPLAVVGTSLEELSARKYKDHKMAEQGSCTSCGIILEKGTKCRISKGSGISGQDEYLCLVCALLVELNFGESLLGDKELKKLKVLEDKYGTLIRVTSAEGNKQIVITLGPGGPEEVAEIQGKVDKIMDGAYQGSWDEIEDGLVAKFDKVFQKKEDLNQVAIDMPGEWDKQGTSEGDEEMDSEWGIKEDGWDKEALEPIRKALMQAGKLLYDIESVRVGSSSLIQGDSVEALLEAVDLVAKQLREASDLIKEELPN